MSYQLLPRDNSPIPIPISTNVHSPGASRKMRAFAFFGTAAATGLFFHIILLALGAVPASNRGLAPTINDWWNADSSPPTSPPYDLDAPKSGDETCATSPSSSHNTNTSYIRPGLGQYVVADENEWSMERIKNMVEGTNGYYVRDYSLGLGWNNVRSPCTTSRQATCLQNMCRCDTLSKQAYYMQNY